MAVLDHEGEAEFPYPKENVFDALIQAIPQIKGMKIASSDKLSGQISVKARVSLMSWGENIPISLFEVRPGVTKVSVISTPKTGILFGGAFDLGRNRESIDKILTTASKILSGRQSGHQKEAPTAQPSKMYCIHCGTENAMDAKYCRRCGMEIER